MRDIATMLRNAAHPAHHAKPITNRAGGVGYRRSLKEQVVNVLTTGTLGDTFYATREELAAEAMEVLTEVREKDPHFLARAIVYARTEGMMKLLPVIGLVLLSGGGARTKQLFLDAFPCTVLTPDDLRTFVLVCTSGAITGRKGFGGMVVDPARNFLTKISEYHAVKYGSAASREITLRDIVRMAHPKPGNATAAERLGWLVGGGRKLGDNPELNPQIRALEALKRATTEDEQVALIREGRLPFEVVVPCVKATTPAIWSELLRQAPYMNLLRSLVTFTRHGVFADEENVRFAVTKLTNPRAVERSRVLPFRFLAAWKEYRETENADSRIADAIRAAFELSYLTMPTLGNRTVAIGPDVSGSMSSVPASVKGASRCIDVAGIYTGMLMKRCEGRAIVLPFDTHAHANHQLSARDDALITAERLAAYGGGGTAVGAPVQYLLDRKIAVDAFIGITDNEDWAYGHQGYSARKPFFDLWKDYKREVAPSAKAFLITVAPNRDAVAPQGAKDVRFIYGWSDRVLKYIALGLESGETQTQAIERMDLHVDDPKVELTRGDDTQTEE